jgi:hypothetical protein
LQENTKHVNPTSTPFPPPVPSFSPPTKPNPAKKNERRIKLTFSLHMPCHAAPRIQSMPGLDPARTQNRIARASSPCPWFVRCRPNAKPFRFRFLFPKSGIFDGAQFLSVAPCPIRAQVPSVKSLSEFCPRDVRIAE